MEGVGVHPSATAVGPDGAAVTGVLARSDAGICESTDIALKAPLRLGEHIWTISVLPRESEDVRIHSPYVSR